MKDYGRMTETEVIMTIFDGHDPFDPEAREHELTDEEITAIFHGEYYDTFSQGLRDWIWTEIGHIVDRDIGADIDKEWEEFDEQSFSH